MLKLIPFTTPEDHGWQEAWSLYMRAFPEIERRSLEDHLRLMGHNPLFEADGAWLDGKFAGLIFHWQVGRFRFVEFLAVEDKLRGLNIGSRIMQQMIDRYKEVILEIEPPVDELTRRRLHFYERLGFQVNDYNYVHPSYAEPQTHFNLVVLSYLRPLTREEAHQFANFVRLETLKYSGVITPQVPAIDLE